MRDPEVSQESIYYKHGIPRESDGVHYATEDSETKIQRHDESCIATPLYNGRRIQVLCHFKDRVTLVKLLY